MKKKGLGRGLDAIFPEVTTPLEEPKTGITEIQTELIVSNPYQPRRSFPDEELNSLAQSIREQGLLQPIIVRPLGENYQLVLGERRLRAARLAGLNSIPAIITEATEQQLLEMALIENLQRQDLNPLEEAYAFKTLQEEFTLTHEEIARRLGRDRTSITNTIRLLNLPDQIKELIVRGELSAGHGRALLSLSSAPQQLKTARIILERKLSVRATEDLVKALPREKRIREKKLPLPRFKQWEERIFSVVGARTRIKPRGKQGARLEILFPSLDEVEKFISQLEKTS